MDAVSALTCDCVAGNTTCYTSTQLQLLGISRGCSQTASTLQTLPAEISVTNETVFRYTSSYLISSYSRSYSYS
jgi:hypothetical protein